MVEDNADSWIVAANDITLALRTPPNLRLSAQQMLKINSSLLSFSNNMSRTLHFCMLSSVVFSTVLTMNLYGVQKYSLSQSCSCPHILVSILDGNSTSSFAMAPKHNADPSEFLILILTPYLLGRFPKNS